MEKIEVEPKFIMTDNIKKTINFIKEQFEGYTSFENSNYRYEHTLRTAGIGQTIAMAEGLDVEGLIIACLLHDIGYIECKTEEDFNNHGRISERISRDFLETLLADKDRIDTICYGIRIHTEDPKDILREPTPFELSVQDSDNIDRFDAYRLYLNLKSFKIEDLNPKELVECADLRIKRYSEYINMKCGTKTATDLWIDKISFQLEYFKRMKVQMQNMESFENQ